VGSTDDAQQNIFIDIDVNVYIDVAGSVIFISGDDHIGSILTQN